MTAGMTTEPRASLVEVEQVDRDAATDVYRRFRYGQPPLYTNIAAGRIDHDPIVQTFARHRLEALRTQGDGEGWSEAIAGLDLQALASVIHDARWDQGRDASTWVPMDEDYHSGKVYCMRIANAVQMHLLAAPTQASSREEG